MHLKVLKMMYKKIVRVYIYIYYIYIYVRNEKTCSEKQCNKRM